MKKLFELMNVGYLNILVALAITTYSCSLEQGVPNSSADKKETKITIRSGCDGYADLVKERVSERDHIPLNQILTCDYYGEAFCPVQCCEYHLTTMYNGDKTYIIGEDQDGY